VIFTANRTPDDRKSSSFPALNKHSYIFKIPRQIKGCNPWYIATLFERDEGKVLTNILKTELLKNKKNDKFKVLRTSRDWNRGPTMIMS